MIATDYKTDEYINIVVIAKEYHNNIYIHDIE